jgi:hypothetical protein
VSGVRCAVCGCGVRGAVSGVRGVGCGVWGAGCRVCKVWGVEGGVPGAGCGVCGGRGVQEEGCGRRGVVSGASDVLIVARCLQGVGFSA